VAGHAGDDPEHGHDGHEGAADGASHPTQTVALALPVGTADDAFGELTDADHAHRGHPATGLQPPTTTHPYGRKASGRGPALTLLASALAGRGQKYPAMSSWDHAGWRTFWCGANSSM
jgi:hypothetical protein